MSTTLQRRSLRVLGALVALIVALCCASIGVAGAAEPSGSIELGADEPTTTITVDGAPIEMIPATSRELPPEAPGASSAEPSVSSISEAQETVAASSESGIQVQGLSSSTGPTSSAGVGGPASAVWYVVGAVVVLGAMALWLVRARRAARH